MEENTKTVPQKMSYEELEREAAQYSQQAQQLYVRLQEANIANTIKRLELLFKVVENSPAFSEEFVAKCVKEIEDTMTLPEGNTEDTSVEE